METLDKIKLFLAVAGVHGTQADYELYEGKLFPEEAEEFFKAYAKKDRVEMLDGLADMEFLARCLDVIHKGNKLKAYPSATDWMKVIDSSTDLSPFKYSYVRKALDRVCDSNLTKFDKTLGEARLTAVKYSHIGIDTYQPETSGGLIPTFSLYDQRDINGDFYPKDKLLKSATNYKAPDFTGIL